jgi:prepilin-type N-terminal cleavage/methylation domain-containing protein
MNHTSPHFWVCNPGPGREPYRRETKGLTLIEVLVVIAIVGTLAALLLPATSRFKVKTQVQTARLEIDQIATAIAEYESIYGRFPVSGEASRAAAIGDDDVTYGAVIKETHTWLAGPVSYLTNNCELMAVLLDLEYYRDGASTINQGHIRNPRQVRFLNAPTSDNTNAAHGVGIDGVYRDPWGSPYVVTLDLNCDGRARDALYREPAVSANPKNPKLGLRGLVRGTDAKGKVFFEATAPVMVWSAGPDRYVDTKEKADRGVNRDNILSWGR